MGFMLPDLKIHSKSARTFQKKNGKSWSLKNGHFSAEKKSSFLGSPKCVSLLRAARDRFYDKKIDFTIKKSIFYERGAGNSGISSETTLESGIRIFGLPYFGFPLQGLFKRGRGEAVLCLVG